MRRKRTVEAIVMALGSVVWASVAFGQQAAARPGQAPAADAATRPPLLFREEWREPTHKGEATDENMRFTPECVTNPRIEAKLYGRDAHVVRVAQHEGRHDLWTGMTNSPVALTLKDTRSYMDLTGLARLRWIVRTNAIHTLYPVVKLADGTLIVGDRAINTNGEFLQVDVAFSGMRWYRLDPMKVVVMLEVAHPDLGKVDEVGLATLSPAGHGIAGSANFSHVEMYAKAVPR